MAVVAGNQYALISQRLMSDKSQRFFSDCAGNYWINTSLRSLFPKTVLSLFTGAGGLDIGLEAAGFETIACIETDEDCRRTIEFNRPNWKLTKDGDIRHLSASKLLAEMGIATGELGLVVGGPPCQPFSNLGMGRGQDDVKNGDLYSHFVRVVEETLPKGLIFENVEGLSQTKHRQVVDYLERSLSGLGYKLSKRVLNSADYGDPQIRKRFVILGVRSDCPCGMPMPTHFESYARAISFYQSIFSEIPNEIHLWKTVGEALAEMDTSRRTRDDNITMSVSEKVLERMRLIEPGQNFKVLPPSLLPDCWKSGKHQGQDTFGRLRPERPSVTIRTSAYNSAKGRYIHPFEDRGLSTGEMAQLQSFPQDWHFKCASKQTLVGIGRQIGNAVPIKLATALGKAMAVMMES